MHPAVIGAEAEPEPTSTPAAIKVAPNTENRLCRMPPSLEVGQSSRFTDGFVNPQHGLSEGRPRRAEPRGRSASRTNEVKLRDVLQI
jgi:hypothetical protein